MEVSIEFLSLVIIFSSNILFSLIVNDYLFLVFFIYFKFLIFFFFSFLAALGVRCCTWAFSSCSEQGLLFFAVCGLLIAVASLAVEHRL